MRAPLSLLPLCLDDVVFEVGPRRIIDGISMQLDAGPRTVILGPNGAGKSVLLRLCHGLLTPTGGKHRVECPRDCGRAAPAGDGVPASRDAAPLGVGQRDLRAETGRRFLAANAKSARWKRCARWDSKRSAGHSARVLSGGEQQRLALARVWALRPEVLFLDEPTASLDPGATHEIEKVIVALHAAGTKIVMVTHNLGQAHRLGDEILFLHQGRLVERAPADRFLKHPASPEAAQFLEGELPW